MNKTNETECRAIINAAMSNDISALKTHYKALLDKHASNKINDMFDKVNIGDSE